MTIAYLDPATVRGKSQCPQERLIARLQRRRADTLWEMRRKLNARRPVRSTDQVLARAEGVARLVEDYRVATQKLGAIAAIELV